MKIFNLITRVVLTSGLYIFNIDLEEIRYGTWTESTLEDYEFEIEVPKRHLRLVK